MGTPLLPAGSLGVILWAGLALAPPPQDQKPAGRVELESREGRVRERPLEGFRTRDPRSEGALLVRYLGLPVPPSPLPDVRARARVTLRGEDRVEGRVVGGRGERLSLALGGSTPLDLSVEELVSLVFPGRLPGDGSVPAPAADGDRLYLARGRGLDKVDGLVNGFSSEGVSFEGRFGERTHPWDEVVALFFEALEEGGGAPPGVPVVVDLVGGGRLSGGLTRMDAEGVRMATAATPDLFLPAALVREVLVDDGSLRFLSQLPMAGVGPTDLFGGGDDLGMRYPPNVDANFRGDPLRAGGRTWSRGIGVHAPSRLTWTLDGGWKELRGLVAIDDSALENEFHGSVIFRVHVDGELRFESSVVRGGHPPTVLPAVELAGARELVLEVGTAGEAFVSDRADWLRLVLVRG